MVRTSARGTISALEYPISIIGFSIVDIARATKRANVSITREGIMVAEYVAVMLIMRVMVMKACCCPGDVSVVVKQIINNIKVGKFISYHTLSGQRHNIKRPDTSVLLSCL